MAFRWICMRPDSVRLLGHPSVWIHLDHNLYIYEWISKFFGTVFIHNEEVCHLKNYIWLGQRSRSCGLDKLSMNNVLVYFFMCSCFQLGQVQTLLTDNKCNKTKMIVGFDCWHSITLWIQCSNILRLYSTVIWCCWILCHWNVVSFGPKFMIYDPYVHSGLALV